MKRIVVLTLAFLLCSKVWAQTEDVLVVVNKSSAPLSLSSNQIKNLFMGGVVGKNLYPIALERGNIARTVFNTRVLGLTEARIQSYWAQMRFGGRQDRPIEVSDNKAVIDYLTNNPDAIGYLPANIDLPDNLVIVYTTANYR